MIGNRLIVFTGGQTPIKLTTMVAGSVWVGVVVAGTFSVAHCVTWLQLHRRLPLTAAMLLHVQMGVGLVSVGTALLHLLHCLRLASTVNIVLHVSFFFFVQFLLLSTIENLLQINFFPDRSSRILNFLFLLMKVMELVSN